LICLNLITGGSNEQVILFYQGKYVNEKIEAWGAVFGQHNDRRSVIGECTDGLAIRVCVPVLLG
jgi:hypothetical protein